MPFHRIEVISLLFFLLLVQSAQAYDLDRLELPPNTEVKWIADNIEQNGVPMQIQQFSSGMDVAEVLKFYRQQWESRATDDMPGYLENDIPGWHVISMLDNHDIVALQIREAAGGGTEGFVSTADIRSKAAQDELTREFPRPSGTQLISSTKSFDLGKEATTILMMNSLSMESVATFYTDTMPAEGWSAGLKSRHGNTAVMLYEKDSISCELSITDNERGKIVIIANLNTK